MIIITILESNNLIVKMSLSITTYVIDSLETRIIFDKMTSRLKKLLEI